MVVGTYSIRGIRTALVLPLNIIIIKLNLASFCWCYHYFSDFTYSCISLPILHLFLLTELFQQRNKLILIQISVLYSNLDLIRHSVYSPCLFYNSFSNPVIHSLVTDFLIGQFHFFYLSMHEFMHSFTDPFLQSFIHSFINHFMDSFSHSFMHSFHTFIH